MLRSFMLCIVVAAIGGCTDQPAQPPATRPASPATRSIASPTSGPSTLPALPPIVFGSGNLEVVKVKLPAPVIIGTLKDPPPDVEKESGRPRPQFMAPVGTVNLALNRPVTSSDASPTTGRLEQITDGEKRGVDDAVVDLAPGIQWVQIDLGKPATIYALLIWHDHRDKRIINNVVIQISDDPDFITGVTTVFNNDQANEAGLGAGRDRRYIENNEGRLMDAKQTKGRYVRCYSNGYVGGSGNRYTEVEVYGK